MTTTKPGQELVGHSGNDEITTPRPLYDWLNRRFQFDYDAFASHENHLEGHYSTKDGTFWSPTKRVFVNGECDGYSYPWGGLRVFWNPVYSEGETACGEACKKKRCAAREHHIDYDVKGMRHAIEKAIEERNSAEISVGLVKCDTSTKNFELLQRYFHIEYQPRIKYGGMKQGATFASAIVIAKPDVWRPSRG